ncbi:uncharacterized protein LOC133196678 [Saccostrea echinata]|uniref:uncharacterized protein LOC133196678 n=1 Tax=Saccostrea echinata TaxID=191078 RepID=UPI002A819DFB|nr:uncharacterized protein LOC133196678 [Saccostrea echinata]
MADRNSEECLFHGDRVQFHALTRGLKENRVIPKTYLTRLASAVCSCRRHKTNTSQLMTMDDLRHVMEHLEEVELPKMTLALRNCLRGIIKETHSLEQYGKTKLLYIVYNALVNSSFDELTYNSINSRPKPMPTTTDVQKQRMTKEQFVCMKNKRLSRKELVRQINLPMFGRNIKKFTESAEYKCVKQDYDNVKLFVWFCDKENTDFINSNQKKTAVKLYMKDLREFEAVKYKLVQIAEKIQTLQDTQREARKSARRAYRYYHDPTDFEPDFRSITDIALQVKESSESEYKKKTIKKKAKKSSILTGGHCMNCLAPFVDIHTSDRECRHHPGYIMNPKLVWSCCRRRCGEQKADHTMHKRTGCSTTQHNWRPHKKHQAKVVKDLFDESD